MLAAEKAESKQQHCITTAFFCALRMYYWHVKKQIIHGLAYPSTMTDNVGLNVVAFEYFSNDFIAYHGIFRLFYVSI